MGQGLQTELAPLEATVGGRTQTSIPHEFRTATGWASSETAHLRGPDQRTLLSGDSPLGVAGLSAGERLNSLTNAALQTGV